MTEQEYQQATVKAEVHTDNGLDQAYFDAAPYFADPDTTDGDLLELARCGFGGDYPADNVARYFEDKDRDVTILFRRHDALVGTPRETGFECHVDRADAVKWIRAHRPYLLEAVWEAVAPFVSVPPGGGTLSRPPGRIKEVGDT